MIGNITVVLIESVNLWLRLANGEDFIRSTGLLLSALAVLLLLYNGWRGWEMVYRHRVGITPESAGALNR